MFYDSQQLSENLDTAVSLKRSGRVEEALIVYEQLNQMFPNSGVVYMSWAKSLIVAGYYNKAMEKMGIAVKLYYEEGNQHQSMICYGHLDKLEQNKKSNFNTANSDFHEYVRSVSGQPPHLFSIKKCKD